MSNNYLPSDKRYDKMIYNKIPCSGLKLPAISLGFWHNFGSSTPFDKQQEIVRGAFDMGITHFDLANNYGPTAGAAEENFGRIFAEDLKAYRDELIIATKAGYDMWSGPYGNGGSLKYLVSSCDQSLKRLRLDYVDIFYNHRRDTETPLEETAMALDKIYRDGKALYVGVSNYLAEDTEKMSQLLADLKTPFVIHQPNYSLLNREIEAELKPTLTQLGLGAIAFSPLAQGILTDRYLTNVPEDSRAHSSSQFLTEERVQQDIEKVRKLNEIAKRRNQTMAEMAIAWLLRDGVITSVLVGASRLSQLQDNVKALDNIVFSAEELSEIEMILEK
ncbi:glyceraldehyde 3-phosphate reductase [Lactococcus hodotermopsidis]|uniref:Glyceraldehyde 3-phosphate reductase n=1 Tax=Pseudolactococcus hodotermopsidis TaxID=2709157 RepID=A0A6A0BDC4_9LACT|nr:aldo/keto reductase [Lactococcus hodotermopsidis]GFH43412.1 glyceraldehyde 3-phosphate reductase [Lactococcus hodotermopsidis]